MEIDAIVLAGGDASRVDPSFTGPKSLIKVGGKPMIDYVMTALRDCAELRRTVIALPPGADRADFPWPADDFVEDAAGVIDAIKKSVLTLGEDGYMLIVSSDAPLITALGIKDFVGKCKREQADVYYSIIRKETTEAAFPGTRRTYLNLKDGTFTGGNVHLARKETFMRNTETGELMFDLRKNPLSILRLLGLGFVLKYITGRLDVRTLENKAAEVLDAKVKAVITVYPELGIDVDKPEDLELINTYLGNKRQDV